MAFKINGVDVINNSGEQTNIAGVALNGTKNNVGELIYDFDNPNVYSGSNGDEFGRAVAISGNYAVIGAKGEDELTGNESGVVYVFDVSNGKLLRTIKNPNAYDTPASDNFGEFVDIDGKRIIVGAQFEDDAGGTSSGKAYLFDADTGFLLKTYDSPNDYNTSADDNYGCAVGISGDIAIIGAKGEDTASGTSVGAAYLVNAYEGKEYKFSIYPLVNEVLWTLNNPDASGTDDQFGSTVGISGTRAIVGSKGSDLDGTNSGRAYIYDVATGNVLHTLSNPSPSNTQVGDEFGSSVAIDGDRAIVGAPQEDDSGSGSGAAYIFNVTDGSLVHTLLNPNAYDTSASDNFGNDVDISGNLAIVGAYNEDDAGGTGSGKAYIFNVSTGDLICTLDNPNTFATTAGNAFSRYAVGISSGRALVGAPFTPSAGGVNTNVGRAYLFRADQSVTYNVNSDKLKPLNRLKNLKGDQSYEDILFDSVIPAPYFGLKTQFPSSASTPDFETTPKSLRGMSVSEIGNADLPFSVSQTPSLPRQKQDYLETADWSNDSTFGSATNNPNYIKIDGLNFGTDDFTIEWYGTCSGAFQGECFWTIGSGSTVLMAQSMDDVSPVPSLNGTLVSSTTFNFTGTDAVSNLASSYIHNAVSRKNGVLYYAMDGFVDSSTPACTGNFPPDTELHFKSYNAGTFSVTGSGSTARLFEFKITPGKALYTQDYVPPLSIL